MAFSRTAVSITGTTTSGSTTVATNGTTTIGRAFNVNWTGHLTHTYN